MFSPLHLLPLSESSSFVAFWPLHLLGDFGLSSMIGASSPALPASHFRQPWPTGISLTHPFLARNLHRRSCSAPRSSPFFRELAVKLALSSSIVRRVHANSSSRGGSMGLPHSVLPTSPELVSSMDGIYEFICSGPLIEKLGYTSQSVEESLNKWLDCGAQLCKFFQFDERSLSDPQKVRLYHYYIPVYLWCEDQISYHQSKFNDGDEAPPVVIGISAPQGCGKTTLVFALDFLFHKYGRVAATLSIDDFYLTAEDQVKLRSQHPGNALLELRGNAGSHDLALSVDTLSILTKLTKKGMKMKLPRYEKSANSGRGDRAHPSTWPEVEGPVDVVLFEGWMLGFKPLANETVKAVDPQLEVVNKNLEAYYDAWDKFIDAWLVIKIKDPSCVYQWRLQAEIAMRQEGKPGMTDEEVLDFVSRYLPAYKAYLPTLYSEGPNRSTQDHLLVVDIDDKRNPILQI